MINHIENNFYTVHSENTCNRSAGSFALKVNVSIFLSSCKETLAVKNEFTQEACLLHMVFKEAPESLLCSERQKQKTKPYDGLKQVSKVVKIYLRRTVKEAVAEHWPRKFLALIVYFPLSLTDAFRISREYTFLERLTLIFEEIEI